MQYPLCSVPFSLGTPDGHLAKNNKATGMSYIIKDALTLNSYPSKEDKLIVIQDGNALYHTIREVPGTFKGICDKIFDMLPKQVDIIFSTDIYNTGSIKSSERQLRGSSDKFIIHSESTKKSSDWKLFLCNNDNKKQLAALLLKIWSSNEFAGRQIIVEVEGIATKLYSTDGCSTIKEGISSLESTQEETDSRIILYSMNAAANNYTAIKVRSPDSDVFFLLLNFSSSLQLSIFFESGVGNKKYCISLSKLAAHLRNLKCSALLRLSA